MAKKKERIKKKIITVIIILFCPWQNVAIYHLKHEEFICLIWVILYSLIILYVFKGLPNSRVKVHVLQSITWLVQLCGVNYRLHFVLQISCGFKEFVSVIIINSTLSSYKGTKILLLCKLLCSILFSVFHFCYFHQRQEAEMQNFHYLLLN